MPLVDCIAPSYLENCRTTGWFTRLKWYTAAQLQDLAELEDWDPDALKIALTKPGRAIDTGVLGKPFSSAHWLIAGRTLGMALSQPEADKNLKLFQVMYHYYIAISEAGFPCLYRETIHGASKQTLKHEVLPHWHGKIPFVAVRRKREGAKEILAALGIPEEVVTHQNAIKANHDAMTDRTDKELNPPALIPQRMADGQTSIDDGPGGRIPMRRSGTLEYLKPPPVSLDPTEVNRAEWDLIDMFYGRPTKDVPPPLVQMHQQSTVDDFLSDLSELHQMIYDLCQERVSDEDWLRITGSAKPPMDRKHLDFTITYDVRDLDLKWLKDKLSLMNEMVLGTDSDAVVDRGKYTRWAAGAVDPVMARSGIIKDGQQALTDETEEEKQAIAVIMTGQEPAQLPDQNHIQRAQYMQHDRETNPDTQMGLRDPRKLAIWEARLKYHLDYAQQFGPGANSNAQIGRTMQQPALEPKATEMMGAGQ
jgi:hypothetical protein